MENATMNQTENQDKILDRIGKLLRLSKGTHSQEEAHSAMLKVQDMLSTYHLTMDQVHLDENDSKSEKRVLHTESDITRSRMPWWWGNIASVVAKNLRCYIYFGYTLNPATMEAQKVMYFIGLEKDVEACIATIKFAINAANDCWKAYKKNQSISGRDVCLNGFAVCARNRGSAVKNDYLKGFIRGLDEQFFNQVQEKGLIIVKDQLVTEEYAKLKLRKGASSSISINGDSGAYNRGYSDSTGLKKDRYITN